LTWVVEFGKNAIHRQRFTEGNEMNTRYALRTNTIADCRAMWSTGGIWSAEVPAVDKLMTGPQVDAFAKRHPNAQIVDVIVHRAACAVWMQAFRAATVENSTHEQRQSARAAGDAALVASGYRADMLRAA
jgi:hypothetical protein